MKVNKKLRVFLQKQGCILKSTWGFECMGCVEIHHIRKNTGLALKPLDIESKSSNIVPLCHMHHMVFHSLGKDTFRKTYNLDLKEKANELYMKFTSKGILKK